MMAPKIMIRPCMVVNWLNSSGWKNCSPGENSSVRTSNANTPPSNNMKKENSRYIVPMSLWLVAKTHRRQPVGRSCSTCPSLAGMWSTVTLLIVDSFPAFRAAVWAPRCKKWIGFRPNLAQGQHVGRLYDRIFTLARVAPGIACVGDHCSYFGVVQLITEGRHGGPQMAVQYGQDLLFHGGQYVFGVAIKCREYRWHALAIGLVAGYAVRAVYRFTARDELVGVPYF